MIDVIVITGTRRSSPAVVAAIKQLVAEIKAEQPVLPVIIHGGAPGVDETAGQLFGTANCWRIDAPWALFEDLAGPTRNAAIVGAAAECDARGLRVKAFAFPGPESRGTWDCVRKLRTAGIEVDVREIRT